MADSLPERIKVYSNASGLSHITLENAVSGYLGFDQIGTGDHNVKTSHHQKDNDPVIVESEDHHASWLRLRIWSSVRPAKLK